MSLNLVMGTEGNDPNLIGTEFDDEIWLCRKNRWMLSWESLNLESRFPNVHSIFVQMATLFARNHLTQSPLVLPLPLELPRFGGDDARMGG